MFIVFGYEIEATRQKWLKENQPEKGETEASYNARRDAAFANFKGRKIAEYDVLSTAQEYVNRVQKIGFHAEIKFYKLTQTGNKKRPVGRTLCDIHELPRLDLSEQDKLKNMMCRPYFA